MWCTVHGTVRMVPLAIDPTGLVQGAVLRLGLG